MNYLIVRLKERLKGSIMNYLIVRLKENLVFYSLVRKLYPKTNRKKFHSPDFVNRKKRLYLPRLRKTKKKIPYYDIILE